MKKNIITTLLVLLLLIFAGCSNDLTQAEVNQLKDENANLNEELNKAIENLEAAEQKIAELELTLGLLLPTQGDQNTDPQTVSTKTSTIPSEYKPKDMLVGGEWYCQDFYEDGFFSWILSINFNADGTGTISRTYYIPKEEAEDETLLLQNFDSSAKLVWTLDNNNLKINLENGESGNYIFDPEKQQFIQETTSSTKPIFARTRPAALENYVERALFSDELIIAQKENIKSKFYGDWYFDVLVWTLNDDGTGVLDIPKLGNQPATKREFSYSLTVDLNSEDAYDDGIYICMVIDWSDNTTAYFYPTFNKDGSITLHNADDTESIKLTKNFDITNCPLSQTIVQNGISVLSGSIFKDFLSDSIIDKILK